MPARRVEPLTNPVSLSLDGEPVVAEAGEPVAQAFVAADKLALARSPKLHRPRGPWCMRGGCDGCLMRVDGVPNTMTCLTPAAQGMRVETQNVFGTRTTDLLRVTDWFFPDGIDHHHLMAGIPGLSSVMQAFARRVAGLGTLPERPAPPASGGASSPDVLVIGAGPSGLSAASTLARAGLRVTLVDDGLSAGGGARALGEPSLSWLLHRCPLDGVRSLAHTTAAGVFGSSVLVCSATLAEIITPRALVLASGAHDGGLLFENNDLPGIFSARAAAQMAASGVHVGARVVIAGQGPFSEALRRHLDGKAHTEVIEAAALVKAEGSSRVGGVLFRDGDETRRIRCDALVIDVPPAPAFELAEQAGAEALWSHPSGFVPRCGHDGRVLPWVWATGELRGTAFDLVRLVDDGRLVAAAVQEALK